MPMQVVTVFLGSFLVGSFFTNFRNWLDDPSQAATILGTAAPLQSIFFLNYIMFNVWPISWCVEGQSQVLLFCDRTCGVKYGQGG